MNEREVSKKWVAAHLRLHPQDYFLRLHDCPWGAKLFDAVIFCGKTAIALEFKVDRRKSWRYTLKELPPHQKRELALFSNGTTRRSKVVVYHVETRAWFEMEVTS